MLDARAAIAGVVVSLLAGCQGTATTSDRPRPLDARRAPPVATVDAAPAKAPADAPPTDAAPALPVEPDMKLTWTLRRDGDHLVVDYTVENGGAAQIWVADRLLQNTASGQTMAAVDRLVVRNGDEPDVVSLVRGMTYESLSPGRARQPPSPAMKSLPPGGTLHATATVPWPLEAWHNYGKVAALAGDKRRAVLELTCIDQPDDPKVLGTVPLEGGGTATDVDPYYLRSHARRITSEPLPLP